MSDQNDERAGLLSASGAERVYHCPGSLAAERQSPEAEEATPESEQGTRIHHALETGDLSGLSGEEQNIARALERIAGEALREWAEDHQGDVPPGQPLAAIGREERFWIRHRKTLKPLASAKLDRFCVRVRAGFVVDFKTGFLEAPPSYRNTQLKIQALTLWHEYPELTSIRVGIAQHRFKSSFNYCDYSVADLQFAEQELLLALWRSEQMDAPRFAGDWCRHCKARGNCREAATLALLPIPTAAKTELKTQADAKAAVAQLEPEALAAIIRRKAVIESVLEACSNRMRLMGAAQLEAVGYQLSPNSPRREISDLQRCFDILFERKLIDANELIACSKASIGKLEELCVPRLARLKSIKEAQAAEEFADLIAPTVTMKPVVPSLKPLNRK